ncbi:hypothetical protein ACF08M_03470 [Streptomyces sp. NPDC015032]|uniref:hypothetical protein n=1 Tax=Streptomyces sp. NPDC015032 TaxID=3364937 RepID=UPI0037025AF9
MLLVGALVSGAALAALPVVAVVAVVAMYGVLPLAQYAAGVARAANAALVRLVPAARRLPGMVTVAGPASGAVRMPVCEEASAPAPERQAQPG